MRAIRHLARLDADIIEEQPRKTGTVPSQYSFVRFVQEKDRGRDFGEARDGADDTASIELYICRIVENTLGPLTQPQACGAIAPSVSLRPSSDAIHQPDNGLSERSPESIVPSDCGHEIGVDGSL